MSGSVASVRNVNGRGTGVAVPRDHHHEAALETLTEEPPHRGTPHRGTPPHPPGLMGKPRPPQENRQSATVNKVKTKQTDTVDRETGKASKCWLC